MARFARVYSVLAAVLLPAAAEAAPPEPTAASMAEAALIHDLEKIVELSESTDWKIDRYEYDDMMPDTLESVCATLPATREAAHARLLRRELALGGPVEEAYRRAGGDLDAVRRLRYVTRVRTLLGEAMRRAPTECPFWITPSATFRGKQTDARRFTLNLEGGGLFVLYHQQDEGSSLGGGGSARLLFARGIDLSYSILFGPEFGGAALFDQTKSGEFPIVFVAALPAVLRHHDISWHYDLEVAPIALFTSLEPRPGWGGRVGVLLGISTPRFRHIMPWGGLGIAGEFLLPSEARPATRALKGGLRLGFDWDFSGDDEAR